MAKSHKNRRRPRRRGPGALLVLLCIVLISAAVITAMTVFFKIKNININGEIRYSREQLISALNIKSGENMFLFNKFAAISRAFDACPYIDEISIRRRLPDTMEITVTECVPVGVITDGQKQYLVDKRLKILEEADTALAAKYCAIGGLQLLSPEVGKTAVLSEEEKKNPLLSLLNTAVDNGIMSQINTIDITHAFDIQFGYKDRFTVKIGTVDDLGKKIRFMNVVIGQLAETDKGTIDVSALPTARFRPY